MNDHQPPGGYPPPPGYGQQPPRGAPGPSPQQPVYAAPPPAGPPTYGAPPPGPPPHGYAAPAYGQPPGPPPVYGQPSSGYGPQPGDGQQPSNSSSNTGKIVLIGGGVLLVVVILALVLLLTRGGGSDSPQATSESFIAAAVEDRDCDAVQELVTERLSNQIGDRGGRADITGTGGDWVTRTWWTRARTRRPCTCRSATPAGTRTSWRASWTFELSLSLVKEDGAWLVDEIGVAGFEDLEGLPEDEPAG